MKALKPVANMNREEKEYFQENYREWKNLVNMSASQLKEYINSDDGKSSGMSRKDVAKMRSKGSSIVRGYDSAKAIIRMKEKRVKDWNKTDITWMYRQIGFLKRTIPQQHNFLDHEGRTRYLKGLLIWGHSPKIFGNDQYLYEEKKYRIKFPY
jgi:hypothetical protein